MLLIFKDPFLYFGLAVWPISYFLYRYKVVDYFRNFKGFSVPAWFPTRINAHSIERGGYVSMEVKAWNLNWSMYQVASMMFLGGFIWAMFFLTKFNQNIIMLRSANVLLTSEQANALGTGHWLIWVAAFIVYFRYGAPFDFIKGVYAMAFFGALHEGMWYIVYVSYTGLGSLYVNSPFLILISGMVFGYLLLFRKDHKTYILPSENACIPWKKLALILFGFALFYVLWYEAGFPITLDIMTGHTAYYSSPAVNLIENLSWLMPALLFL